MLLIKFMNLGVIINGFRRHSYIFYFIIVASFVLIKINMGWKFADKKGKRDDKMPVGMKWVNAGFISLFVIFTAAMTWTNRGGKAAVILPMLIVCGIMIGIIVLELKESTKFGLVKNDDHLSYGPAVAVLLFVVSNIYIHLRMPGLDGGFKSVVTMLTIAALIMYGVATVLNGFKASGAHIVELNNSRDLRIGEYAEKFTAYSSISMGEVAVVEAAIPLIVAVYLYQNFEVKAGGGIGEYNSHILGVLVLGLFCAGISRLIANVVKRIVVKPRPCAARMAGCNLANNNISCKGCKSCKGNIDAVNCNKTCYYSDVNEKVLTQNCMCKGMWGDFELEEDDLKCENMWSRKMELYPVGYYKEKDQQKALAQAFQSMPSGHTLSAWFVAWFVLAVWWVGRKMFKFGAVYFMFILATLLYAGLVTYSRVYDGWHWTHDCLAGAVIAGLCVLVFIGYGYQYIGTFIRRGNLFETVKDIIGTKIAKKKMPATQGGIEMTG